MAEQTNTVDELMEIDPLELTATDIDSIIAYHRKARANASSGGKRAKPTGPKLDLTEIIGGLVPAQATALPTIRRR